MEKSNRRPGRLPAHDYSSAGCYFITFCTKMKQCLLSRIVARGALAPPDVELLEAGQALELLIRNIPTVYPGISVDKYVIMPNHVHLILRIEDGEEGSGARAPRATETREANGGARAPRATEPPRATETRSPTVMAVIGGLKSLTRRKIGLPLWQTSFYDHVIRGEADYLRVWEYMENNPARWAEDEYYVTEETGGCL